MSNREGYCYREFNHRRCSQTGPENIPFVPVQVYCNSIGCPNGYAPIDDAQNVECKKGYCSVSQCCNLFCNAIGCPNGYTPIEDADKVLCYKEKCTVSQCCEAFCSYHPCPNNYVPVDGAEDILCPTSGCTDDLCCEFGESRSHLDRGSMPDAHKERPDQYDSAMHFCT